MSTQLESWKYFDQQNVQSNDAGEVTLGTLPGSVDEVKPTFSMPLMWLEGILGGLGFCGVISALYALKGVFDNGVAVEMMKKMQPHGLDKVGLAMAEANNQWMMLIITGVIIKIIISCGFMGSAVMLKQRVDYANWFAGLICLGAIVYNLLDLGLRYMMLPDFTQHGVSRGEADAIMMGIVAVMGGFFFLKMVIYLGLVVFLNNKTNTAIFTPQERQSLA